MVISQILLWAAVIVQALLIAALARQIGVLHERIAPAGALSLPQSVKVGEVATPLTLTTVAGGTIEIGGQNRRAGNARSQLLFFASPDCPVCKSLLPVVRSAARAEAGWVDIILAGDGAVAGYRQLAKAHGVEDMPMVLSEALGRAYGVSKLPYAVLIDEAGRVASTGLVNSREHLESLFVAKEHGVASIQDYLAKRNGDA